MSTLKPTTYFQRTLLIHDLKQRLCSNSTTYQLNCTGTDTVAVQVDGTRRIPYGHDVRYGCLRGNPQRTKSLLGIAHYLQ